MNAGDLSTITPCEIALLDADVPVASISRPKQVLVAGASPGAHRFFDFGLGQGRVG